MALEDATRIEEECPLDGPSKLFEQHHDVVNRTGGPGKRVNTKVEQLLAGSYITPEQSSGAKRFTDDYLKGCIGRSKSCLDISPGGGGAGSQSEERHDAARCFEEARVALDGMRSYAAHGMAPSAILLSCCVEDMPFSTIARHIFVTAEVAKARVAQLLGKLELHYQHVDRQSGKDRTPRTQAGAMRLFDPDLADVARTADQSS